MRHYGTELALSYRDKLHVERVKKMTVFNIILNVLSFYTFHSYTERLHAVWSDNVVTSAEWKNLLRSFVADWTDSNLLVSFQLFRRCSQLIPFRLLFFSRKFPHFLEHRRRDIQFDLI
jgi:hypothetical protein